MGFINLIEDPSNPGKPADTHMGKNISHVTVTFDEVSAPSVLGFTTDHTTPSWLHSISTVQKMYDCITWLHGISEILSDPKPVFLVLLFLFYSFHEKIRRM